MRSEDVLFEFKPCHDCPHNCVESQPNAKCLYDKMAEDLVYAEEWDYIQSQQNSEQE